MRQITVIFTVTRDGMMSRPACELYRNVEQAQRNVLRREYESGIVTFLRTFLGRADHPVWATIRPVGDVF